MSSLERARQFVARKASQLALTIVPLAALAIAGPAHAASVGLAFDAPPSGCFFSNLSAAFAEGGCAVSGTLGGTAGASGLALAGFGASSGGGLINYSYRFSASGGANGSFEGNLPVSWLFTAYSNGSIFYDLDISATTNGVNADVVHAQFSGSATSGVEVNGSSFLPLTAATTSWSIRLNVSETGGSFLNVNIPGNSTIDINPQSAVVEEAPEPASFLLFGAGTGAFLLLRRRKTA